MSQSKPLNEDQRDALQKVIKKATVDEKVRKQLLTNPNTVLKQFGINVAEFPKVRFVENKGSDMTIVLPDPVEAAPELSEEELEQIAGGLMSAARTESCSGRAQITCCHTHIVIKRAEEF